MNFIVNINFISYLLIFFLLTLLNTANAIKCGAKCKSCAMSCQLRLTSFKNKQSCALSCSPEFRDQKVSFVDPYWNCIHTECLKSGTGLPKTIQSDDDWNKWDCPRKCLTKNNSPDHLANINDVQLDAECDEMCRMCRFTCHVSATRYAKDIAHNTSNASLEDSDMKKLIVSLRERAMECISSCEKCQTPCLKLQDESNQKRCWRSCCPSFSHSQTVNFYGPYYDCMSEQCFVSSALNRIMPAQITSDHQFTNWQCHKRCAKVESVWKNEIILESKVHCNAKCAECQQRCDYLVFPYHRYTCKTACSELFSSKNKSPKHFTSNSGYYQCLHDNCFEDVGAMVEKLRPTIDTSLPTTGLDMNFYGWKCRQNCWHQNPNSWKNYANKNDSIQQQPQQDWNTIDDIWPSKSSAPQEPGVIDAQILTKAKDLLRCQCIETELKIIKGQKFAIDLFNQLEAAVNSKKQKKIKPKKGLKIKEKNAKELKKGIKELGKEIDEEIDSLNEKPSEEPPGNSNSDRDGTQSQSSPSYTELAATTESSVARNETEVASESVTDLFATTISTEVTTETSLNGKTTTVKHSSSSSSDSSSSRSEVSPVYNEITATTESSIAQNETEVASESVTDLFTTTASTEVTTEISLNVKTTKLKQIISSSSSRTTITKSTTENLSHTSSSTPADDSILENGDIDAISNITANDNGTTSSNIGSSSRHTTITKTTTENLPHTSSSGTPADDSILDTDVATNITANITGTTSSIIIDSSDDTTIGSTGFETTTESSINDIRENADTIDEQFDDNSSDNTDEILKSKDNGTNTMEDADQDSEAIKNIVDSVPDSGGDEEMVTDASNKPIAKSMKPMTRIKKKRRMRKNLTNKLVVNSGKKRRRRKKLKPIVKQLNLMPNNTDNYTKIVMKEVLAYVRIIVTTTTTAASTTTTTANTTEELNDNTGTIVSSVSSFSKATTDSDLVNSKNETVTDETVGKINETTETSISSAMRETTINDKSVVKIIETNETTETAISSAINETIDTTETTVDSTAYTTEASVTLESVLNETELSVATVNDTSLTVTPSDEDISTVTPTASLDAKIKARADSVTESEGEDVDNATTVNYNTGKNTLTTKISVTVTASSLRATTDRLTTVEISEQITNKSDSIDQSSDSDNVTDSVTVNTVSVLSSSIITVSSESVEDIADIVTESENNSTEQIDENLYASKLTTRSDNRFGSTTTSSSGSSTRGLKSTIKINKTELKENIKTGNKTEKLLSTSEAPLMNSDASDLNTELFESTNMLNMSTTPSQSIEDNADIVTESEGNNSTKSIDKNFVASKQTTSSSNNIGSTTSSSSSSTRSLKPTIKINKSELKANKKMRNKTENLLSTSESPLMNSDASDSNTELFDSTHMLNMSTTPSQSIEDNADIVTESEGNNSTKSIDKNFLAPKQTTSSSNNIGSTTSSARIIIKPTIKTNQTELNAIEKRENETEKLFADSGEEEPFSSNFSDATTVTRAHIIVSTASPQSIENNANIVTENEGFASSVASIYSSVRNTVTQQMPENSGDVATNAFNRIESEADIVTDNYLADTTLPLLPETKLATDNGLDGNTNQRTEAISDLSVNTDNTVEKSVANSANIMTENYLPVQSDSMVTNSYNTEPLPASLVTNIYNTELPANEARDQFDSLATTNPVVYGASVAPNDAYNVTVVQEVMQKNSSSIDGNAGDDTVAKESDHPIANIVDTFDRKTTINSLIDETYATIGVESLTSGGEQPIIATELPLNPTDKIINPEIDGREPSLDISGSLDVKLNPQKDDTEMKPNSDVKGREPSLDISGYSLDVKMNPLKDDTEIKPNSDVKPNAMNDNMDDDRNGMFRFGIANVAVKGDLRKKKLSIAVQKDNRLPIDDISKFSPQKDDKEGDDTDKQNVDAKPANDNVDDDRSDMFKFGAGNVAVKGDLRKKKLSIAVNQKDDNKEGDSDKQNTDNNVDDDRNDMFKYSAGNLAVKGDLRKKKVSVAVNQKDNRIPVGDFSSNIF